MRLYPAKPVRKLSERSLKTSGLQNQERLSKSLKPAHVVRVITPLVAKVRVITNPILQVKRWLKAAARANDLPKVNLDSSKELVLPPLLLDWGEERLT